MANPLALLTALVVPQAHPAKAFSDSGLLDFCPYLGQNTPDCTCLLNYPIIFKAPIEQGQQQDRLTLQSPSGKLPLHQLLL